jgi:hypothetical protein
MHVLCWLRPTWHVTLTRRPRTADVRFIRPRPDHPPLLLTLTGTAPHTITVVASASASRGGLWRLEAECLARICRDMMDNIMVIRSCDNIDMIRVCQGTLP